MPKNVSIMILCEKYEGSCWLTVLTWVTREMKDWLIQSFKCTTAVHGSGFKASHDYNGRDERNLRHHGLSFGLLCLQSKCYGY